MLETIKLMMEKPTSVNLPCKVDFVSVLKVIEFILLDHFDVNIFHVLKIIGIENWYNNSLAQVGK